MADSDGKKLNLVVLTVGREVYKGEADSVTGLGTDGEFTILPNHIAFMTPLGIGILTARNRKKEKAIALHAGFLRVEDDTVTVLADAAELAQDIDVERARAARQRAEELQRRSSEEGSDAALRRALLRLRVAGKD